MEYVIDNSDGTVFNSNKLEGKSAKDFAKSDQDCPSGQTLKGIDSNGDKICASDQRCDNTSCGTINTNKLNVTEICVSGDCQTSWPTGGGGGEAACKGTYQPCGSTSECCTGLSCEYSSGAMKCIVRCASVGCYCGDTGTCHSAGDLVCWSGICQYAVH